MLRLEEVVESAAAAKAQGATRFCMGAAWRGPKQRDIEKMVEMVGAVKALGLETCATLGMLKPGQAEQLREAGLDYYNHNLDTSPNFTVKSSLPAAIRIGWTLWKKCEMPGSMYVAAASSGWANRAMPAPA